jgi:hypothetical protein
MATDEINAVSYFEKAVKSLEGNLPWPEYYLIRGLLRMAQELGLGNAGRGSGDVPGEPRDEGP